MLYCDHLQEAGGDLHVGSW